MDYRELPYCPPNAMLPIHRMPRSLDFWVFTGISLLASARRQEELEKLRKKFVRNLKTRKNKCKWNTQQKMAERSD